MLSDTMHAQIKICMDSPAFAEKEGREELVSIIQMAAKLAETGLREFTLNDADGRNVGTFRIIGQPRRFAR